MFSNLLALKLEYAMSVYQKFRDCKTAGPFLCPCMIFARAWASHALGRGKSPFHPRSRCFVSAWVLDLRKNTGWFTVEKVPFLWSTIYPANFGEKKKIRTLTLVPSSISPLLVLPSIRRYRIECLALYAVLATKYLFRTHNWLSNGLPKWPKP